MVAYWCLNNRLGIFRACNRVFLDHHHAPVPPSSAQPSEGLRTGVFLFTTGVRGIVGVYEFDVSFIVVSVTSYLLVNGWMVY